LQGEPPPPPPVLFFKEKPPVPVKKTGLLSVDCSLLSVQWFLFLQGLFSQFFSPPPGGVFWSVFFRGGVFFFFVGPPPRPPPPPPPPPSNPTLLCNRASTFSVAFLVPADLFFAQAGPRSFASSFREYYGFFPPREAPPWGVFFFPPTSPRLLPFESSFPLNDSRRLFFFFLAYFLPF